MPSATQTVLDWLSPLIGDYQITTQYGAPVAAGSTKGDPHYGLDFGAPLGTPVYAPADMFVKRADDKDAGGGNIVELERDGISLVFAHLRNFVVKPGEKVRAGEIIGYTGMSGASVTGPHLHLEAKRNGTPFNPLDLFDALGDVDGGAYSETARRQPVQADGNCPVGFHRVNDGFFGIGGDMEGAYCEADSLPGAAVAGALDWTVQLARFLGELLNPANWLAWAALGGGVVLSFFGLYMIWSST